MTILVAFAPAVQREENGRGGCAPAEVKALAPDLAKVFNAQGIHREALAALRVFRRAVEKDEATAALAGRVLRYLFRARGMVWRP